MGRRCVANAGFGADIGREPAHSGTSVLCQEETFGCRRLSKTTSSCRDPAVEANASARGLEKWAVIGVVVLGGRRQLPAVRAYRRDHASAVGGHAAFGDEEAERP